MFVITDKISELAELLFWFFRPNVLPAKLAFLSWNCEENNSFIFETTEVFKNKLKLNMYSCQF